MANPYEDFLGSFTLESPDFKRALKILIKYEIHVLVGILNKKTFNIKIYTLYILISTYAPISAHPGQ